MRLHRIILTCFIHLSSRCVSFYLVPKHSSSRHHSRDETYFQPITARRKDVDGDYKYNSSLSRVDDDGDEFVINVVQLQSSSIQERSDDSCGNDDGTSTSSTLVFETASHIVQHYLSPSEDVSSEFSSRPLLRRIAGNDVDVTTNSRNCWADMFAPLYYSANSAPETLSPSPIPNNDESRIQQRKKRHRINLKLSIAYRGQEFCGWEDQRHTLLREGNNNNTPRFQLPSVQGMLVDILDPILGHEQKYGSPLRKPIEIKVAGRTDAGVSAIGQICRIRTWRHLPLEDGESVERFVKKYVNNHVNMSLRNNASGPNSPSQLSPLLRVRNVECVDDTFHPTFGASCRAYVYLIDVDMFDDNTISRSDFWEEDRGVGEVGCDNFPPVRQKGMSSTVIVQRLNSMLRALVGQELDYIALSYGKVKTQTTLCTLHHARAHVVEWEASDDGGGSGGASRKHRQQAICIELVGDRFLRRMVRILVATAMREATSRSAANVNSDDDDGSRAGSDALLSIVLSQDRERRAKAAPPDGLIFVGAAY